MAGAITKIQGLLKTIDAAYWIKNISLEEMINKQIRKEDRIGAAGDGRKTFGNGSHMQ